MASPSRRTRSVPQSTVLPAQPVEFVSNMLFPPTGTVFSDGAVLTPGVHSFSRPGSQQATLLIAGNAQTSAGTVGPQIEQVGGKTCCRVSTTTGLQSQWWRPSVWMPSFDDATFNPGAFLDPGSVVAVIDFEVACFQVAHVAGSEDVTGFWFQPRTAVVQPLVANQAPAGSVGGGGFGVALNDDGAGNNEWEFISYRNVGPPPLQFVLRVPIGAAFVPDVRDWTLFRWTIVSAASGRPATMTLEVNGTGVPGLIGKVFDNVFPGGLFTPEGLQPGIPVGFILGQALGVMGGVGYRYRLFGRFGRFTADGVEVQPI